MYSPFIPSWTDSEPIKAWNRPQHICGMLQEVQCPVTAATILSAPVGAATGLQHHDRHPEPLLPAAGTGTQ